MKVVDLVPQLESYRWEVKVGDAVAVELPQDKKSIIPNEYYPYNSPWWPGIVVSIFKENKDRDDRVQLEIRWCEQDGDGLFETDHVDEVHGISLLGPVELVSRKGVSDQTFDLLPSKRFACNKFLCHSLQGIKEDIIDFTVEGRRDRGILYSKHKAYKAHMLKTDENNMGKEEKVSKKRKCDTKSISP